MTNKFFSRKFIAYLVWTILVFVTIIVTGQVDSTVISWYGAITAFYLGSNTLVKYIPTKKE